MSAAATNTTSGADVGAALARIGAVLAAAEQLAAELEDGVSPDAFAKVTALQCVVAEGRTQVRAAEQALAGAVAEPRPLRLVSPE